MFYLFENKETQLTHELELIKENVERANSTEKNINFTNNKTKNSLSENTISTEKETINKDNKEKEISILNDLISEKKQNIKLIKAELAYLSRPERLQSIAKQQFNMKEILPSDIWNINDISKLYFEKN